MASQTTKYIYRFGNKRADGNSGMKPLLGGTDAQLPWKLLGVHSARVDMGGRDLQLDDT
jgi:hypothetical protein